MKSSDDVSPSDSKREADLEAPIVEGNAWQKFELSLPFARTNADIFAKRVRQAATLCERAGTGDGSSVTLDSLREVFQTPAWADLH